MGITLGVTVRAKMRAMLWTVGAALVLALLSAPMAPAEAQDKARRYGLSTAPWWQVGDHNKALSLLCQRNEFNQIHKDALYIGYIGADNRGRTLTGIAKRGWNLYDPRGRAQDGMTYHFRNDGFSNCQVYEATQQDLEAIGAQPAN
ncbi:MAG: hypothetical protein ACPGOY_05715 [Rhodospirillaceae bacterium]